MTRPHIRRILLVEDNPADVFLLKEAFQNSGLAFDLITAADGEKALALLFDGKTPDTCPDLILLDLNLPKINGHTVLQRIKSDPRTEMIPAIVMSSSGASSDVALAYSEHANCYIRKPTNLEELFRTVRAIKSFWLDVVQLPPAPAHGNARSASGSS
ncbi:MAG: response regulator [Acidobacteriaceae bacterium]|nr:response regulator [Acidobacteriaceae bacterium]MBV8571349.1 response regulator [Acidobacteriaceae bacterium]